MGWGDMGQQNAILWGNYRNMSGKNSYGLCNKVHFQEIQYPRCKNNLYLGLDFQCYHICIS